MTDQFVLALLSIVATPIIGVLIWLAKKNHDATVEREKRREAMLDKTHERVTQTFESATVAMTAHTEQVRANTTTLSGVASSLERLHARVEDVHERLDATPLEHRFPGYRPPKKAKED